MSDAGAARPPSFAEVTAQRPVEPGAASGVLPVDAVPTGEARVTVARLDRSWWSWSSPHGGLLGALALRAAQGVVAADRVPQCLSLQFLAAAGEGDLTLHAQVLRAGGSSDVVRVDAAQHGAPVLTATATLARPRPGGTSYDAVPLPPARAVGECSEVPPAVDQVPFSQHLRLRQVSGTAMSGGATAELVAWLRWADPDQAVDAASLVVFVDALAPALYGIATVPVAVPTVDLTVTLTGPPVGSDWVLARISTRTAHDGWCVDDSDVWSPDGQLLAQGRQTRRVLGDVRPPS